MPLTRRCGRCLVDFPDDPDAEETVLQEFWMCPHCRDVLLGKLSHAGVRLSRPAGRRPLR